MFTNDTREAVRQIKGSREHIRLRYICSTIRSGNATKEEHRSEIDELIGKLDAMVSLARGGMTPEQVAEFEQELSAEMRGYCLLSGAKQMINPAPRL